MIHADVVANGTGFCDASWPATASRRPPLAMVVLAPSGMACGSPDATGVRKSATTPCRSLAFRRTEAARYGFRTCPSCRRHGARGTVCLSAAASQPRIRRRRRPHAGARHRRQRRRACRRVRHPAEATSLSGQGRITFVHRRLWPALVRVAGRRPSVRLAQVREVHTRSGHHVTTEVPFPDWVPSSVRAAARALSEEAALAAFPWIRPASRFDRS